LETSEGENGGSMPPRVLVVDDEPIVREVLARYLGRGGFAVDTAEDGQQALDVFSASDPDLVLLDLMLPRVDGLEVFTRIRSRAPTPVIMLTARGEETDRVLGLELGADDYIAKPFSPREVVARVRSVLRRSGGPDAADEEPMRFGNLEIDGRSRRVSLRGETLSLTPKEFDVLHLLAANPGRVFSRLELLEELWDFAFEGDPSTVTVHIRRLREKIEADPGHPRHLVTVWGAGYRFDP
jgi:two-component system, OmpR family, response regulator ResD